MSSDQSPHHPSFNDDDVMDDDDDENTSFNGPTSDTSSSDTNTNTNTTPTLTAVTIAIPATTVPATTTTTSTATTIVTLPKKKPPVGLFQRLWTDEDEIELLQGFLDYTTSRGTAGSSHHHDTAAFYDQIKSKLQLDFNKNQLVEKLRRLKKKYRTALGKMSSGKEFAFKSAHDQTTFDISSKIWSSLKTSGKHPCVEYDDDEPNPNANYTPEMNSGGGGSGSGGFYISQINLNTPVSDQNKGSFSSIGGGNHGKLSTRKRPRVVDKIDEAKFSKVGFIESGRNDGVDYNVNANNVNVTVDGGGGGSGGGHNGSTNVYGGVAIQGLIEETVRSTLSPMFKELVKNAVSGSGLGCGRKGIGAEELGLNVVPLNFPRVNSGEVINEKWRKQQILELEVYSRRLELVQDQIKLTLDELRSMSGVNDRGFRS